MSAGYGYLFGLFPVNVLHNLVHLGIGAWGVASYRKYAAARTFAYGLTIFYGLLAVMGLIPVLNTSFGLIPIFGHDVWLHALFALAASYFWRAPPELWFRSKHVRNRPHVAAPVPLSAPCREVYKPCMSPC
ncbi:MAG: DUF4383 domain-containing protein [Gammaproteobacteria bacterium]